VWGFFVATGVVTGLVSLPTDGLKQDSIPVELEEGLLRARKSTNVHGIRGVDDSRSIRTK
jgi:hypothetical protein